MRSEVPYDLKVTATYKDFDPLVFDLKVAYTANLDGKSKFVNLGTHVFIKNNENRKEKVDIHMVDVINNALDEEE